MNPSDHQKASSSQGNSSKNYLQRLAVKHGSRVILLKATEIDWIEAAGKYLQLHAGQNVYRIRQTMGRMRELLDPQHFVQVHRCSIVNLDRIAEFEMSISRKRMILLNNGKRVPLARSYFAHLQKSLLVT